MSNIYVKCHMSRSNVKYQMPEVNYVKLLSERTSRAPPVIFFSVGEVFDLNFYILKFFFVVTAFFFFSSFSSVRYLISFSNMLPDFQASTAMLPLLGKGLFWLDLSVMANHDAHQKSPFLVNRWNCSIRKVV